MPTLKPCQLQGRWNTSDHKVVDDQIPTFYLLPSLANKTRIHTQYNQFPNQWLQMQTTSRLSACGSSNFKAREDTFIMERYIGILAGDGAGQEKCPVLQGGRWQGIRTLSPCQASLRPSLSTTLPPWTGNVCGENMHFRVRETWVQILAEPGKSH